MFGLVNKTLTHRRLTGTRLSTQKRKKTFTLTVLEKKGHQWHCKQCKHYKPVSNVLFIIVYVYYVCIHVYVYLYVYICVWCLYGPLYMYVCTSVYISVYVCMCGWMYVCMCGWMYVHIGPYTSV